ncbi:cellulose synthase-like protein G3 [Corchorus capsularis]|uniref:Cellulose synthase-like protein G3 n=1 Tax=Corchorus capsularis TaxID=210143 RepID=A0A1R3HIU9_COCAP|nr:cellulose synthase-like protein G3 [Corchorus capsularis]
MEMFQKMEGDDITQLIIQNQNNMGSGSSSEESKGKEGTHSIGITIREESSENISNSLFAGIDNITDEDLALAYLLDEPNTNKEEPEPAKSNNLPLDLGVDSQDKAHEAMAVGCLIAGRSVMMTLRIQWPAVEVGVSALMGVSNEIAFSVWLILEKSCEDMFKETNLDPLSSRIQAAANDYFRFCDENKVKVLVKNTDGSQKWAPPPVRWMIVTTDSVFSREYGKTANGLVLKIDKGFVLIFFESNSYELYKFQRVFFSGPSELVSPEFDELNPNHVVDKPIKSQEILEFAHHVAGCNYENQTKWGYLVDAPLIATGRAPFINGLGLENVNDLLLEK